MTAVVKCIVMLALLAVFFKQQLFVKSGLVDKSSQKHKPATFDEQECSDLDPNTDADDKSDIGLVRKPQKTSSKIPMHASSSKLIKPRKEISTGKTVKKSGNPSLSKNEPQIIGHKRSNNHLAQTAAQHPVLRIMNDHHKTLSQAKNHRLTPDVLNQEESDKNNGNYSDIHICYV